MKIAAVAEQHSIIQCGTFLKQLVICRLSFVHSGFGLDNLSFQVGSWGHRRAVSAITRCPLNNPRGLSRCPRSHVGSFD